jgi:mannan endo-1,4-beta-mannosidase
MNYNCFTFYLKNIIDKTKRLKTLCVACILLLIYTISIFSAPCNPNATSEAKALLQYLVSISGKKILSGQESMYSDGSFPSSRDKTIKTKTGKYPALYTSDFGDVNTSNLSDRKKVVDNAIAYHKAGSIIAFQYHMIQPDLADGAGFSAMNIKGSTYTKIDDILTEGSTLNKEFKKRLDEMAGYFNTLETNKIAVLWRPFHEMNGDFFWWSFQPRFKELWKYEWNYLTNTKKCNNLLWVFGVNWYSESSTGKSLPSYYYPGHDFVDVLGCDVYTKYSHSYDQRIHDTLRVLGAGKPIALAENGTMPDIRTLRVKQPYWVYWATWWGFEGESEGNFDSLYTKNYSDSSVITQDEVTLPAVSTLGNSLERNDRSRDKGFDLTQRPEGLFYTIRSAEAATNVYTVNGKCAIKLNGTSGFVLRHQLSPGIYIFRGCNPTAASKAVRLPFP